VLTDTFTCGCSINAHGFVDYNSGKRIEHLKPSSRTARPKASVKAKSGR
jgi:hypothetical protein